MYVTLTHWPLAPIELNFRYSIFWIISVIDGWGISCELALRWMLLDLTDDKSTLVQVMAWCRQATSHYLSQCWPRSLSPYGVTRPLWVNCSSTWQYSCNIAVLSHWQGRVDYKFNPLGAKFFRVNINIYLHFMSFLHSDMTQVLKILPQVR